MLNSSIDYHVTDVGGAWGIFRGEAQIGVRQCPCDAIAFANFFADWESLSSRRRVNVLSDPDLHHTLRSYRANA
ncbi:hypothetical protein FHW69_002501 [Luteibacter sp. Sphag1AF]|uniref:hypothetical protein n=1 Tax=Luteibacter sp. Sphag1AF TaxID=2587031 RepID=UPI00160B1178|nr:hypothetical protein [Luteibacter sp. Sphag1AF]MBB3227869.1 hypothetical protein [Luteibacter sp. Sphag1AF]